MKCLSSTTESLQVEISLLTSENQKLLAQEACLLSQLESIRRRLFESNEQINTTMEDILTQLIADRRSQAQADFWEGFNKNEIVFRGLSKSMDGDPELKAAVHAVAAETSTDVQEKTVLLALMTELSGQPSSILSTIAKRAIKFNDKGKAPVRSSAGTDSNAPVEIMDLDDAADANRHQSVLSHVDSEVKSEGASGFFYCDSPAAASEVGAGTGTERLPITPTPLRQGFGLGSQANTNTFTQGIPGNQRSASDLLQELYATPPVRPIARPGLGAMSTPARSVASPFTDGNRITKKPKPIKEVAVPTAFVLFMKKLEVAHAQNALPIAEHLKCSKCDQIKRDSRVLNCLHVYCHKCTQKLRVDAEVGSAEHGFKAFCVKPNCSEVVSGKTAVIDTDVMELLVWYDKQSPGLTTSTAQMHVFKSVLKKKPTHSMVTLMMDDLKKKMKAREQTGENDEVCNLLEVAKLAKKLGLNS